MIADDKLIGWIVMVRLAFDGDRDPFLPTIVQRHLVERGWLEIDPEPQWNGHKQAHITDAGLAVTDLHGPEWGIDTMPETNEA